MNLPRSKIKRSRKSRTEPTLYAETVRFADIVLEPLAIDDAVFGFGHRQALKIMHSVVNKTGASCMPNNDPVRWKDLRSGMACHLLKNGWSREEVDARLGHTPQSTALNAYINYLAIDRERPKKRLFDSSLEEIQNELEQAKQREKLTADRLQRQQEESKLLLMTAHAVQFLALQDTCSQEQKAQQQQRLVRTEQISHRAGARV